MRRLAVNSQPAEQGTQLDTAFRIEQGMQLVNDDTIEFTEKTGNLKAAKNEHRFQGLGCDQQDPARILAGLGL